MRGSSTHPKAWRKPRRSLWRKPEEMFWRYAFVACEKDATRTPRAVFERHRLKGACEQRFSEVLADLDLHHPPCLALIANRAFYALATLAYNILTALKVLERDDEHQAWRARTIIRHLLTVPATLVCHANRRKLRICLPAGMMRWWRLFLARCVPRRKRGEGLAESYWPVRNE
ncbi:MAG: transposase [Kiritimatiellaeota bacterium]|nr:transposase [Kiritimatiellota bacterium]